MSKTKKPLVSVCMGTAQVDRPLLDNNESVYELLRRSLENQTYQGLFEVIVADAREDRLSREIQASWNCASRVVLTKQVHHDRIAISAARNTAASYARGELLVFVDDCTELLPSFLEAAVALHKRGKVPTRLLLTSTMTPHVGKKSTRKMLRDGLAGGCFEYVDPLWRDHGYPLDETTWKLTGQAGGVFVLAREQFMRLNGFDENFDGNWGCEDQEFCVRLDRLKLSRVGCCDLAVMRRPHHSTPLRATVRRCRELYAQWSYRSARVDANRRLSDEVLKQLRHAPPCAVTCELCAAPDREQQIESYRAIPAEFDLRTLSEIYSARPSGIYLDTWR